MMHLVVYRPSAQVFNTSVLKQTQGTMFISIHKIAEDKEDKNLDKFWIKSGLKDMDGTLVSQATRIADFWEN